ncbi:MAG: hypothetical protein B1H11_12520 [Desulfobacteraceae bacterium 4484_190.1]|nr:MAG: hypothetical protein B1H11_12520 [Desulfobacteraceae bacterium 4484_190.1]
MEGIDICVFMASLCLGGIGAFLVARWGARLSLLDRPNERSSHEHVTPRGGGIGILAAFVLCSLCFSVPAYFWIPALLLSLVSFAGDRFELGVLSRLFAQFILAGYFVLCFGCSRFSGAPFFYTVILSLFFLVFIVGTANYYNFMDGINGIAAITGIVGFGLLGLYGHAAGKHSGFVSLGFGMAAACAGFLPWNVPRASVFMGDVGSILLGFVFAALIAVFSKSPDEFLVMAGFMLPFYADELVTLTERVRDGESLTRPHRRHLYQVLANEGGIPHWKVSVGYGVCQAVAGVCVWKVSGYGTFWIITALAVFLGIFIIVNRKVKTRFERLV